MNHREKLERHPEDAGELLKALTWPSLHSLQLERRDGAAKGGGSGASQKAPLTHFALDFPGFLLGVVVVSLTFCAHVAGEGLSVQLRKTGIIFCVPGSARRPGPAPPDTQRSTDATQVSVHQQTNG